MTLVRMKNFFKARELLAIELAVRQKRQLIEMHQDLWNHIFWQSLCQIRFHCRVCYRINLTDYRAFAYLAVILAFTLSSPSPHTAGPGMGALCLLYYLCIEVWLLNLQLAGLPLFCRYINLGYFLAIIPTTAFFIASSFQLYGLFQALPFTVWIAEGFQAARAQDWASYALHLLVLLPIAAVGVALGAFLCTRTYLLSARGVGASE